MNNFDNIDSEYAYDGELGAVWSPEATRFAVWSPETESAELSADYVPQKVALRFLPQSTRYILLPTTHHFPLLCEIVVNTLLLFSYNFPSILILIIFNLHDTFFLLQEVK